MFRFASLSRRRRGRALFERLLSGTELQPFKDIALGVQEVHRPLAAGPVSMGLGTLLGDWEPDLSALDASTRAAYTAAAAPDERLYLRLHLAVWQGAPGFVETSGLSRADPPAGIHAMARGPLAAGGSFSAADMIGEVIEQEANDSSRGRALDFGASSGRVVRVLAAAYPGIKWEACDPNAAAIRWAAENLSPIGFFASPEDPPLQVESAAYELVYAISVWSHFGQRAARDWLQEMHRIVAPGGLLVLTTQGLQTIRSLAAAGEWKPHDINRALADLCRSGHHFHDVFARDGDHGIRHDEWGWAFIGSEWLLDLVTPEWIVKRYAPGRHESNQDLWVLQRA
jgi:SAM-dependent methyltransferase